MVNYDVPWNPARLEQRMGRIHRYGQKHDPVIISTWSPRKTREGRVLKTLLDKLERIRKELGSDKVFDVIGRLFEGVSLQGVHGAGGHSDGADDAARARGHADQGAGRSAGGAERRLYGDGGDVRSQLDDLKVVLAAEETRRLLPGYVMRFVQKAAPRLDLKIEGDLQREFALQPLKSGAMDRLLPLLDRYEPDARGQFTVYRPDRERKAIFLHPGEPVFESLRTLVRERLGIAADRGAVFVDATATEPYLFRVALITIVRNASEDTVGLGNAEVLEQRLVGIRQSANGACEVDAVEQLLVLRPEFGPLPSAAATLAAFADKHLDSATAFMREQVARSIAKRSVQPC